MVDKKDTIVAIATPPGNGGIGVIRISGPATKGVAKTMLGKALSPREACLCNFKNADGQHIDQGIAIFFPAPASYTGEDVLEMHGHGGRVVLDMLVKRVLELGARQALPGEFTERAFLNGKIDLLQAEAVADLINSNSAQAARGAIRSLKGEFSNKLYELHDKITNMRTLVEGALDFPEEDIDVINPIAIKQQLNEYIEVINEILTRAEQGARLQQGAQAVIIGRPNVGKSSLLNQLAGRDSAIVTAAPGTTRDIVNEDILLDGMSLRIIDTAGLRKAANEAEQEGVKRARNAAENADILLLMVECGQKLNKEENAIADQSRKMNHVVIIYNKIDLHNIKARQKKPDKEQIKIYLSAKTGEGIDLLLMHLSDHLGLCEYGEDVILARARHIESLKQAKGYFEHGLQKYSREHPELLAEELRLAQESLGEIVGKVGADDLLESIFSRFCIGK